MKKIYYNKLADTELRNSRFKKANAARKRVMIAKDVLAQLGTRFIAKHLCWVGDPSVDTNSRLKYKNKNQEVCDITSKLKTCNVCGIGALFVSAVEFADKLKVNDVFDGYVENTSFGLEKGDLWKYLGQFFSHKQLNEIECAFEGGDGLIGPGDANCSDLFFDDIDLDLDPGTRMRLIMENIVVNKGTFDHSKRPVVKQVIVTPGYEN